ncbi:MBL fold metallo-hydrolase [Spirochaeta thermophila]|uniref:MBL fold metallo-hydrolase n=1 Tax=Winmispira thermophila TaxID=154 RepID=UPI00247A91C6|nr:MBL fold metallo-hydrolase [Spirochaeta thermophila]
MPTTITRRNERVEILILVDNKASPRFRAEHGFSVLVRMRQRSILFDTGAGAALSHNASVLGVGRDEIQVVVLSHGHYDHTGGLTWWEGEVSPTLYLSPYALQSRYSVRAGQARPIGMPAEARAWVNSLPPDRVVWTTEPHMIEEGCWVTGPISRSPHEDTGGPYFLDEEGRFPDPMLEDQAMWVETEEGLVVISGCAHAGIVSTLEYVIRVAGASKIRAVIGGFHLAHASVARLTYTAEHLARLGVHTLVPCHCTGEDAVSFLSRSLEGRVVTGEVGFRLSF